MTTVELSVAIHAAARGATAGGDRFAHPIPLPSQVWGLYLGGGFNLLIGLSHRDGFFTELKVCVIDSPGLKIGSGHSF